MTYLSLPMAMSNPGLSCSPGIAAVTPQIAAASSRERSVLMAVVSGPDLLPAGCTMRCADYRCPGPC